MAIVGGLDVHRKQITFDYLDSNTGEVRRGRIPGSRLALREWLAKVQGRPAAFAVEGCTGWRFVVEELRRAGMDPHLAEPAETRAKRGPKRHAKTDGLDARHLRELLQTRTLPESWIPPEHLQEMRTRVRVYKDLVDERTSWLQRIQALLFHQGVVLEGDLLVAERRQKLEAGEGLSPAAHEAVASARAASWRGKDHPFCAGRWMKRRRPERAARPRIGITSCRSRSDWAAIEPRCRWRGSSSAARITGCARWVTKRWSQSGNECLCARPSVIAMEGFDAASSHRPCRPGAGPGWPRKNERPPPRVRGVPESPSCRRTQSAHRDKVGHPCTILRPFSPACPGGTRHDMKAVA
jgi:transposase